MLYMYVTYSFCMLPKIQTMDVKYYVSVGTCTYRYILANDVFSYSHMLSHVFTHTHTRTHARKKIDMLGFTGYCGEAFSLTESKCSVQEDLSNFQTTGVPDNPVCSILCGESRW